MDHKQKYINFSRGTTLSGIVSLPQVPSHTGSWWMSSLTWHWTFLAPFFRDSLASLYLPFSQVLQLSVDVFPLRGCEPFFSGLQPTRSRAVYFSGCVPNWSFWPLVYTLDVLTSFPASWFILCTSVLLHMAWHLPSLKPWVFWWVIQPTSSSQALKQLSLLSHSLLSPLTAVLMIFLLVLSKGAFPIF